MNCNQMSCNVMYTCNQMHCNVTDCNTLKHILAQRELKFYNFFWLFHDSSIGDLVRSTSPGWLGTTNIQSLHNATEWPQRLVTFETFDHNDEET